MKHRKLMLWALLGLIGLAMIAGIVGVLMPARFVNYKIILTAVIVGLYGLGGMFIIAIGVRQHLILRVCAALLAMSMVAYLFTIWADSVIDWETMEYISKAGSLALFLGLLLAHRMLIAPILAHGTAAWISKRTALISAMVLYLLASVGLAFNGFGPFDEIGTRVSVVVGIVAVGSTIATGAMAMFGPRAGEDEPGLLEGSIAVELVCPRCEHAITARSNRESRCENCRLKVRVEIEEPRCACGYLLYQLQSDLCPECGRTVEEGERWSGPSIQNA